MKEKVHMQIQRTTWVAVALFQKTQKFELLTCQKSNFPQIN